MKALFNTLALALLCLTPIAALATTQVVNTLPPTCSGTTEVYLPASSVGQLAGLYRCNFGIWVFTPPISAADVVSTGVSLTPLADQIITGGFSLGNDSQDIAFDALNSAASPSNSDFGTAVDSLGRGGLFMSAAAVNVSNVFFYRDGSIVLNPGQTSFYGVGINNAPLYLYGAKAGLSACSHGGASISLQSQFDITLIGLSSGFISLAAPDAAGTHCITFPPATGVVALTTGNPSLQVTAVAFSSLPSCTSGIEGTMRSVTDSNTVTWGANVAGGSTNHVLAYCDGSNWTVAAK